MKIRMGIVAGMLIVSGCVTTGSDYGSTNSPAGGLFASRGSAGKGAVASTIIAAMDGGLVGGTIGEGLDDADRRLALEVGIQALEYTARGQAVSGRARAQATAARSWPAQPYRVGSQDCRQYTQTVSIDGRRQSARGTACRNPDGSWTPLICRPGRCAVNPPQS